MPLLFYPASFLPHKQHHILFDPLVTKFCYHHRIQVILTVCWSDVCKRFDSIKNNEYPHLYFAGRLQRDVVLNTLEAVDAMLFLSKIESLGLPLIESSHLNVPIIAPLEPYAVELLGDSFIPIHSKNGVIDPISLQNSLYRLCTSILPKPKLVPNLKSLDHFSRHLDTIS